MPISLLTPRKPGDPPFILAHRAGSLLAPENTLPAIREAKRLGVDGIEIDVRGGRGREVVVIHDPTLDRTTSGKGWVRRTPWSRMRQYDASGAFNRRMHGVRIPNLNQAIKTSDPTPLIVEIKEVEVTRDVCEQVIRAKAVNRVFLMSFFLSSARTVKRYHPQVVVGHLVELGWRGNLAGTVFRVMEEALEVDARYVCVDVKGCSRRLVRAAHRVGLPVWVWTVDRLEDAERIAAAGADGLITNDPEKMQAWIGERRWEPEAR